MYQLNRIKNSIVTKIIILILVLVLPINILLLAVTKNSMNTVVNQTVFSSESTLNLYMNQLDKDMENIDSFFYSMINDDAYFWQLAEKPEEDKRILARFNLNRQLMKQIWLNSRIAALFWFQEGEQILMATSDGALSEKKELERYVEENATQELGSNWHIIEQNGKEYILHVIRMQNTYLGGFISSQDIVDEVKGAFEYERKSVYLMDEKKLVHGDDLFGIYSKSGLNKSSLTLSLVLSREEIQENLPFLQRLNYYIALLLLAVVPVLLIIFRKILIKPLRRINRALNTIEKQDVTYRIPEYKTSSEFRKINSAFNSMMNQIMQLKIENYEREIDKNKMEVKNLQLQIRPHFLLNSFNLVFSMAQMRDYEGVQKMILCLTTYYRDGVRGSEDYRSVRREIAFIQNYLEIAAMRYPDCFEIELDIEEEAAEVKIPTLLIHTFVENIVAHMVRMGNFLTISILVRRCGRMLLIEITDDGEGIAEKILEKINSGQPVVIKGEEHIGIWNCRKRLCMLYGNRASLDIESEKYTGTRVRINLPIERGECEGDAER